MTDREEFEAWAIEKSYAFRVYDDFVARPAYNTGLMWSAWQAALATAPTAGSAPADNFAEYRRGVREAFDLANTIRANPYGRNAEETCAYIVRSLAELANGGREPPAPASPEASDPMVIARLKESLRAKSSTVLTVTCWRADFSALLATSTGGGK